MTLRKLREAARRRLTRIGGADVRGEDSGFALIFVLLVTTIIIIGVASVLVATAADIVPAKHSQDNDAAYAAAQAGIDDYVAYLTVHCSPSGSGLCNAVNNTPTPGQVAGPDGHGTESYLRTVLNPTTYPGDGFLRVKSQGSANGFSKTLVADIRGANPLLYAYISKYETLASAFLNSYYGSRHIDVASGSAASAATSASPVLSAGSSVTWNPPTGTGAANGYDSSVCDRLWYDDASTPGRYTIKTQRSSLPTGTDWGETGSNISMYQPCEVTFSTGMTFNGPVYTRDAPYMSFGTGGSVGAKGPVFIGPIDHSLPPVTTGWTTSSTPGAVPGQLWRPFPYLQGGPSTASTPADAAIVQTAAADFELPANANDALAGATCVYIGPTRITVSGGTATIMSPLTPSGAGSCYANQNAGVSGPVATGVTSAQVPVATTKIYVQNLGSSSNWLTASGGSVFSLSTPSGVVGPTTGSPADSAIDAGYTPATSQNPTQHPDGAFTPQWTSYTAGATCNGTTPALSDLRFLNCYVPKVTHTPAFTDSYSSVKYGIQSALASSPSSYTTPSALAALVQGAVSTGNSADAGNSNPTNLNFTSHRWQASAVQDAGATDGCTPGTSTSSSSPNVGDPSSDTLLTKTAQGTVTTSVATTTTCLTATVTLQVGTCSALSLLVCIGSPVWGNGTAVLGAGQAVAQFKVTATIKTPATTVTTTSSTMSWPNSSDRTPYSTWNAARTAAPGDVYIEGTGMTGRLSVIAEHDIVVTGKLMTSETASTDPTTGEQTWTSTGGGAIALVADNNVRVYHPVSCADTTGADLSATTVGWCPNDITGLYPLTSGGLESNGTLLSTHPAMQYCNLTGSSANSTSGNNTGNTTNCPASGATAVPVTGSGPVGEIDAAVFALSGSLLTDNYNRGVSMSTVAVKGGIYQLHRGATGEQWETQASDGTRANSGYVLQDSYVDLLPASLPYVPSFTTGSSGRAWNVISISNGPNS